MAHQTFKQKYMFLLKCLHDMDENVTHPLLCLEPSLTPSFMPNPRVRKYCFQNKRILENTLPSFGKYIGLPSEANYWIIFPKQSWVSLRNELLDHSPRKFFGKSSLEISFTTIFHFYFLSCHALTPNFLGCPGAYEMHYVIFTIIHVNLSIMHVYINEQHQHTIDNYN